MTDTQLLTELQKPAYASLRTARNDAGLAALFAVATDSTVWRSSVSRADLLKVVVGLDAYGGLMTARDTPGHPLRSVAYGFLLMLNNPDSTIDFTDAGNQQLAGVLENVTTGLGTAILAVGKRRATLAESLWGAGSVVSADDVSRVLN